MKVHCKTELYSEDAQYMIYAGMTRVNFILLREIHNIFLHGKALSCLTFLSARLLINND
jgi:hypothetical protein